MTIKEEIYEMMLKTDFAYKIHEDVDGDFHTYELTVTNSLVIKDILKLLDAEYEGHSLSLIISTLTNLSNTSITVYGKQVTGNSTHVISDLELLQAIISKINPIKISVSEKYDKVFEYVIEQHELQTKLIKQEDDVDWRNRLSAKQGAYDDVLCTIEELEHESYV